MISELSMTDTATIVKNVSYNSPPSSISDLSQHEADVLRGRRLHRDRSITAKADEDSCDRNEAAVDHISDGKHRKRKRSRKGLDKSFVCPHQGCGRCYSRAEHLYRHQLNRKFYKAFSRS